MITFLTILLQVVFAILQQLLKDDTPEEELQQRRREFDEALAKRDYRQLGMHLSDALDRLRDRQASRATGGSGDPPHSG